MATLNVGIKLGAGTQRLHYETTLGQTTPLTTIYTVPAGAYAEIHIKEIRATSANGIYLYVGGYQFDGLYSVNMSNPEKVLVLGPGQIIQAQDGNSGVDYVKFVADIVEFQNSI